MNRQTETKRIPLSAISQALEQGIDGVDPARAVALQNLHGVRSARAKAMEREHARLSKKLGPRDPRVLALNDRIELDNRLVRDLAVEIERAGTQMPSADKNTWVVHGFVRNKELKGVPNLTVAIYDEKGTWIQAVGYACTDDKGYFKLSFGRPDKTKSQEMATVFIADAAAEPAGLGPGVFIHVLDKNGAHIYVDQQPLTPEPGNVDYREIILDDGTGGCRPPDHDKGPRPGSGDSGELKVGQSRQRDKPEILLKPNQKGGQHRDKGEINILRG